MISSFTQCLFKASNAPHRKRVAFQFVYIRKNTFAGSSPLQISLVKMTFLCGSLTKRLFITLTARAPKIRFALFNLYHIRRFLRDDSLVFHIFPHFSSRQTRYTKGFFAPSNLSCRSFFRLKFVNAQVAASVSRLLNRL